MVAGHSLGSHVRGKRGTVDTRPFNSRYPKFGCRLHYWWPARAGPLSSLPAGGRADRLKASGKPHRLALPRGRALVDNYRHARLPQRLRDGEPRLGSFPGSTRRSEPLVVGAHSGPPWDLRVPALPRREASFEEVASFGLALRGGDRVGEPGAHALPRTLGYAEGHTQSLRPGGSTLGGCCRPCHRPAAPVVHACLGPEPGDALPAFKRRCAPADQVDSLRCLVGGPYLPDRHCGFVYPPIGDLVCRWLTVVVGPHRVCGAAEYYVGPYRHRLRRAQVPPLRHRPHHKPHPRLRLTDGHASRPLLRRHRPVAEGARRPYRHRREVHLRGGGFYLGDRRPVQPAASSGAGLR